MPKQKSLELCQRVELCKKKKVRILSFFFRRFFKSHREELQRGFEATRLYYPCTLVSAVAAQEKRHSKFPPPWRQCRRVMHTCTLEKI